MSLASALPSSSSIESLNTKSTTSFNDPDVSAAATREILARDLDHSQRHEKHQPPFVRQPRIAPPVSDPISFPIKLIEAEDLNPNNPSTNVSSHLIQNGSANAQKQFRNLGLLRGFQATAAKRRSNRGAGRVDVSSSQGARHSKKSIKGSKASNPAVSPRERTRNGRKIMNSVLSNGHDGRGRVYADDDNMGGAKIASQRDQEAPIPTTTTNLISTHQTPTEPTTSTSNKNSTSSSVAAQLAPLPNATLRESHVHMLADGNESRRRESLCERTEVVLRMWLTLDARGRWVMIGK
jgi:hypothetical protein